MKDEPIPADQFEICKRELSRLNKLVDEIDRSLNIAQGIHMHEAQAALYECRKDIETAGYWLAKSLRMLTERRG